MDLTIESFHNWSPIRVYPTGGTLFVDWVYLGEGSFTEPFHDDTIQVLMQEPFNLLFRHQTPIEFLDELFHDSKGIEPTGFIFHVSRCGSTLVSRMFASLETNIVISEASVIDTVIRANATEEQKAVWLRWLINALAQKRSGREKYFFVKFDSWGVLDLPLIERAFPHTPWIFLYRDPVEVIVSNMREPGMQMIPGKIEKIFSTMSINDILQLSTEERFARTIAAFCGAALVSADSVRRKFVNYTRLPDAVTGEIADHFGVSLTNTEGSTMRNSARFNAKMPSEAFRPDGAQKRKEASAETLRCVEDFVAPLYKKLEGSK